MHLNGDSLAVSLEGRYWISAIKSRNDKIPNPIAACGLWDLEFVFGIYCALINNKFICGGKVAAAIEPGNDVQSLGKPRDIYHQER